MRCHLTIIGLVLAAHLAFGQKPPQPARESGFFGVTIQDVGKLALVTTVYRGTAAEKLAREGDLLLQIDDKPVGGTQRLISLIQKRRPGSRIKLLVLRGAREMVLPVTLGKRPADGAGVALTQQRTALGSALLAFYRTNPSGQAAWHKGLEAHRKQAFPASAAYMAFCRALTRHSDMVGLAAGQARSRLARRAAAAGLILEASQAGLRLPENLGQTGSRLAAQRVRVAALIEKLGSAKYGERQEATRGLLALGELARRPIQVAAQSRNLEVRWRARHLLALLAGRQADRARRLMPALFVLVSAKQTGWRLERKAGPTLTTGVVYRAVLLDEKQRGRTVSFRATGPHGGKQVAGAPLRSGARLMYLVLARGNGQAD